MTVEWSGEGLPPAAQQRTLQARRTGTWTSALSTGEFAAIRSVGFEPVGQAMGSAVYHLGYSDRRMGYHDCMFAKAGTRSRDRAPIALSGAGAPSSALVRVLDSARHAALDRLTAECTALGGDGVVSAKLTVHRFPWQPDCLEFEVIGTAVRARGEVRPPRPFTCHLGGQGFAKLVAAGWVPVGLLVAMSVGVRHDDYLERLQSGSVYNQEVAGWTQLVHDVRADARRQLVRQAQVRGGDGVVLGADDLRIREESCTRATRRDSKQFDHVAEETLLGTVVAEFGAEPQRQDTLTVLRLGQRWDWDRL